MKTSKLATGAIPLPQSTNLAPDHYTDVSRLYINVKQRGVQMPSKWGEKINLV